MPRIHDAVVGYANYARFAPGQRAGNGPVESRMCLWCKEGRGVVTVNDQRHVFQPGDYLFLPWRHWVNYEADRQQPFWLAGIHLIPAHTRNRAVDFTIPHSTNHPLAGCSWRHDRDLHPLIDIVTLRLPEEAPLWLLSEYTVRLYMAPDRDELRMRELARMVILELIRTVRASRQIGRQRATDEFQQTCGFITERLAGPLSVADVAVHLQCSTSSVTRLFRVHAQTSPLNWINRQRIQRARQLLTTTRLPVVEIGRQVGVSDPFYFSKLFKQWSGESPRAFRQRTPLL